MPRKVWTALAVLALLCTWLSAMPAVAGYGAIAWDQATGKSGWVWNEPTPQKAAAGAMRRVRHQRLQGGHPHRRQTMCRPGDDKGRQSRGRGGAPDQGRGAAGGAHPVSKAQGRRLHLQTSDCNK